MTISQQKKIILSSKVSFLFSKGSCHVSFFKTVSTIKNMANQTTTQKYPKEETEQSQHLTTSTPFQSLKALPVPLKDFSCTLHKHEIFICGGQSKKDCYSYHTIKNEYKLICKYPSSIDTDGYNVLKLVDNNSKENNEITLLSFGGSSYLKKHAFVMKYISVWSNSDDNGINKSNNYNQWVPFTDNYGHPIYIGRDEDNHRGMRTVIGGSNNHLLFITYASNNISVFDLNTFQIVAHTLLPAYSWIQYHCFVPKPEMMKTNKKKIYEMLLFCAKTGLLIEYNEDNNTFQFHQLPVCKDIEPFYQYAYICVNDIILFFGGHYWKDCNHFISKSVHKYSIQENSWTTFQNTLPSQLYGCVAILSEDNTHIHIIGGQNNEKTTVPTHVKTKGQNNEKIALSLHIKIRGQNNEKITSTHMKTKVRVWDPSQLSKNEIKFVIQYWLRTLNIKLGWIDDFDKIVVKYNIMK
ncbi:hypothetical protein RFI_12465 [Reticulomyxa filosa]|uniref:Kelch motif family protein n=1 Tax=Reticulomyxa filosa TaxID=46433 RepID=X6NEE2_RETFI|nr:hypothetical protein RFI_12465 [Reticulomyxa filosa]|eukprot:ETO24695.1 hypothetical protein RFI_12465 [Reticulomyxa filosa]